MKVRVFDSDGVKVLVPVSPEFLETDTKRFFDGVPYFDCDSSEIPPKRDNAGKCLRCSWVADLINKKVTIKDPCDCVHNKLLVINKILDDVNSTREQKINALLDRELLIRKNTFNT